MLSLTSIIPFHLDFVIHLRRLSHPFVMNLPELLISSFLSDSFILTTNYYFLDYLRLTLAV